MGEAKASTQDLGGGWMRWEMGGVGDGRWERGGGWGGLWAGLAVAGDEPFVGHEAFEGHWAAGMHFLC